MARVHVGVPEAAVGHEIDDGSDHFVVDVRCSLLVEFFGVHVVALGVVRDANPVR